MPLETDNEERKKIDTERFLGEFALLNYLQENKNASYLQFLKDCRETILTYPPFADDWAGLNSAWSKRFFQAKQDHGCDITNREMKDVGYLRFFWTGVIEERKNNAVKGTYDNASLNLLDVAGRAKAEEMEILYTGNLSTKRKSGEDEINDETDLRWDGHSPTRLVISENDRPEKRKFGSVDGETSTSGISSRLEMESEAGGDPFDQVDSLTDYEIEDSGDLLPEECAVVEEEEVKAEIEQDWKKWGANLRRAEKRSKHKHCPENYGIIRCGSGILCSDWMPKKLYQSLQSSLPRADRAPFADYSSSISEILTQISLEGMLEALRSKAPPVNEPRGSKHYIMDRVFNQFARDVFMPDDSVSGIGVSEVCYNHLALWPCMYAAVSGLTSGLGNATFQPGELYLKAIDEVRRFRHQPESRMKVDGVVHIDFAQIELLSMEVSGHQIFSIHS
ncbi:hypothetical protein BC936DRAFT_140705 [Jimgerdemannia flammicorona]|uniref:Uncharacterized protein n=1 Tax=Jimgerdemannia flammicorona TaxID=994334 RepID=A0A433ADA4_9FUNG|nr:hypothetical protein BC936DRAFT_140705 [Jimgerdemannia flammicorona]